jgi:hypothetical protein
MCIYNVYIYISHFTAVTGDIIRNARYVHIYIYINTYIHIYTYICIYNVYIYISFYSGHRGYYKKRWRWGIFPRRGGVLSAHRDRAAGRTQTGTPMCICISIHMYISIHMENSRRWFKCLCTVIVSVYGDMVCYGVRRVGLYVSYKNTDNTVLLTISILSSIVSFHVNGYECILL